MNKSFLHFILAAILLTVVIPMAAQTLITLGTGTDYNGPTTAPTPYGTYYKNFRQQYLYKASEIIAQGGAFGTITRLGFNIQALNSIGTVPHYIIRMKHTSQNVLNTTFETGEYTEVWHETFYVPTTTGWQNHTLTTPFVWDGTSNLLIDIVTTMAATATQNASVYYTTAQLIPDYRSLRFQSNTLPAGSATTGIISHDYANLRMVILSPILPANLVAPALGADAFCNVELSWSPGQGAAPTGYKLYLGTDGGGTVTPINLVNGQVLGNVTNYTHPSFYATNTTYYWKIVPYNSTGDAENCPIWNFDTVPLSGTFSIASGGDFANFTEAINLLNYSGVSSAGVTFAVSGTFTEITPPITASGTENGRIVFQPATEADNPMLLLDVPNSVYGFKLEGADYVTFNNIDITGPNTVSYGYWLMGGATHNRIQACTIFIPYNANLDSYAIYSIGPNDYGEFIDNYLEGDTFKGIRISCYITNHNNYNIVQGNHITNVRYYAILLDYADHAVVSDNIISNSGSSSSFIGIHALAACDDIQVYNNTIQGTATGSIYGIYLNYGINNQIHHNTVTDLHSTVNGDVNGIWASGVDLHVYANLVYNLTYTGTQEIKVRGICLYGDNTRAYNNMISGLSNPNAIAAPQIYGMMFNSGQDSYICNNTIYLNAEGTATNFSSSGLYIGSSALVKLQGNIIVNLSTPGTGGFASSLYSPTGTISILSAGTDRNIYYCGTPDATHLIGKFNNVGYPTLAEYQAAAGTVDQNSYTELVPFVSMTDPIDVHIRTDQPTLVEGDAIPIAWVSEDFDGNPRHLTNPDIGADEGGFTLYPPGNPILLSPANESTGVLPGTALSWKENSSGAVPSSYSVYFGTTNPPPQVATVEALTYQPTLAFSTTYYWKVTAFNSAGQASSDTWSFSTVADPIISALPYSQYFDEVTAPILPYGWSVYKSLETMTVTTNTTYKQSAPNSVRLYNSTSTDGELRFITPEITLPMHTIRLKFYARGSSAGYTLQVGTTNSPNSTGVFNQIRSITLTNYMTEYTVAFSGYNGTDPYICFRHGLGGTSRYLYIDNFYLEEILPNDLAAVELINPGLGAVGTPISFDVKVYNNGTVTQTAYTVHLKRYGDDRLASLPVNTPLAPNATATHTITWTPSAEGTLTLVGEVELLGDVETGNDETPSKLFTIYPTGTTFDSVEIGTSAVVNQRLPVEPYYTYTYTQSIFLQSEINQPDKFITRLEYYYNGNSAWSEPNLDIYLGHTTRNAFSSYSNYVALDSLTLVFSGPYSVPAEPGWVYFNLQIPFAYNNVDNLVIAVNENDGPVSTYHQANDDFYCSAVTGNRSIYFFNNAHGPYNPLDPTIITSIGRNAIAYIPNTMINLANIPDTLSPPQSLQAAYIDGVYYLQWEAVNGATAYKVYKSNDAYAPLPWEQVANIPANVTEYILPFLYNKAFYYITAE